MPGAGEDETRKAPSLVVTADGSVTLFNEDAGNDEVSLVIK